LKKEVSENVDSESNQSHDDNSLDFYLELKAPRSKVLKNNMSEILENQNQDILLENEMTPDNNHIYKL